MRLSLIIPCHNGAPFIATTVETVLAYLRQLPGDAELLVVDDGSDDDSASRIERAIRDAPAARLLRCGTNRGKGHAVRTGVEAAQGDLVVFTDADLAYPPEEIDRIVAALEAGADVAVANRVAGESRFTMSPSFFSYLFTRHVASRLFNRLERWLLALPFEDSQAGLKGFRRQAAAAIFARQTLAGFAFDVEILCIAVRLGLRVREVPVHYHYFNEPTTVDFLGSGVRALADILRVRRNAARGLYR